MIGSSFITVLFDALMVEKIKTFSLNYDAPAILLDELHEEYLRQNVYDEGSFKWLSFVKI